MTQETTTQGGPKINMPQIQAKLAETMKNMSPDQRARMEAFMKKQSARAEGMPESSTKRECITAEQIDKGFKDGMSKQDLSETECNLKEVSRTPSKVVVNITCSGMDKGQIAKAEGRGDGTIMLSQSSTISIELKSPIEMESRFQTSGMIGKEPMKSDMKTHGRWIAADCGKVK